MYNRPKKVTASKRAVKTEVTNLRALFFPRLRRWGWGAFLYAAAVNGYAAESDCLACHEKVDHKQVEQAGDSCAVCHDALTHPAIKGSAVAPRTGEPADRSTGMTVPMYSDQSRLGSQPNEMVSIPAGEFLMGTDERLPDEGPPHKVDLPSFWIDKYEVTNLQYQHFIEQAGRRAPEHFVQRHFPPGKADHPVTFVSWFDAEAYCKWAGKRLPTDEEWEKAARGDDGRTFPWGDEFRLQVANTPVRWSSLGLEGDTTPVGAFPDGASPYGLNDMSGNVWEWTASWYKAYPGNTRESENYGEKYRTLKGGSWWDCSFYKCGISAPVYNRSFFSPKVKNSSFGFRCAKDATSDDGIP